MHLLGLNCALGQQVGKASKRIWDEKRENNNNDNNRQKVISQFSLVTSICSFPKTICNLQIVNPYFHTKQIRGRAARL